MNYSYSVVIPTWNRVQTIEHAIRSVLSQTLPATEIIVCDDGSTDGTEDVVRAYSGRNVVWCPGPHSGCPAVPRNIGISRSQAEWIAFLDSDDAWMPRKMEIQFRRVDESNCRAVSSNAHRRLADNSIAGDVLSVHKKMLSFSDLLVLNYVICSSAVIHRSLLLNVDGFPEDPALRAIEDYALWLRVATQTDIAYVSDSLVEYTDDPLTSIRKGPDTVLAQRKRILTDFLSWATRYEIDEKYLSKAGRMLAPSPWTTLVHKVKSILSA